MPNQDVRDRAVALVAARLDAAEGEPGTSKAADAFAFGFAAAKKLAQLGRNSDAGAVVKLLRDRARRIGGYQEALTLMRVEGLEAQIALTRGELTDAEAALARAIDACASSEILRSHGSAAALMRGRARLLFEREHAEEAIAVLKGARETLRTASAMDEGTRARESALAALALVDILVELGRYQDATSVAEDQARQIPMRARRAHRDGAGAQTSPERVLAILSKFLKQPATWPTSDLDTSDRPGPGECVSAALDLYHVTQHWTVRALGRNTSLVDEAAAVLRAFGDGYAVMASLPPDAKTNERPAPSRRAVYHALSTGNEISQWCMSIGFDLAADLSDEFRSPPMAASTELDLGLVRMLACLFAYLAISNRDPLADDRLFWADDQVRLQGSAYIERARLYLNRVAEDVDDARISVASSCLVIAQALFVGTQAPRTQRAFSET